MANHYRSNRLVLVFQTSIIIFGMASLFGVIGWMLLGVMGIFYAFFIALILFLFTPKLSPWMVLRMYRARPLSYGEIPELYKIIGELSRRAQIKTVPQLYYVPTRVMNAFSVGTSSSSAIAVSDGIIRYLSWREIAGVLAHEMSHIRNNDLKLLSLADLMSRITSLLSFFGQILIVLYLPLAFFSKADIPLMPIVLLIFAPSLSMLLQLALSRAREFSADLGAAYLTGDPAGLASALKKMDQYEQSVWDFIIFPGRKHAHPSLLRTHPHTKRRLERLMSVADGESKPFMDLDSPGRLDEHFPQREGMPQWNWFRQRH
jgi:heat shock protein HtpX